MLEKQNNPKLLFQIWPHPLLYRTVYSKGQEYIPCVSTSETHPFGEGQMAGLGMGTRVLGPEEIFSSKSMQVDVPLGTGGWLIRLIVLTQR